MRPRMRPRRVLRMAKTSMKVKQGRKPKFKTRFYNRCNQCARPRGYIRQFGICRICFRNLASTGMIPGVVKSSW